MFHRFKDWINQDMLFKIRLQSPVLVKILKTLYTVTSAAIKCCKVFFKTATGCRQDGVESPIVFNIYLLCWIQFSFRRPGHCSTREQRSIQVLSGVQRLRMLLYVDDIVLCNDIDELSEILKMIKHLPDLV